MWQFNFKSVQLNRQFNLSQSSSTQFNFKPVEFNGSLLSQLTMQIWRVKQEVSRVVIGCWWLAQHGRVSWSPCGCGGCNSHVATLASQPFWTFLLITRHMSIVPWTIHCDMSIVHVPVHWRIHCNRSIVHVPVHWTIHCKLTLHVCCTHLELWWCYIHSFTFSKWQKKQLLDFTIAVGFQSNVHKSCEFGKCLYACVLVHACEC